MLIGCSSDAQNQTTKNTPTIVSIVSIYDCKTQTSPTASALLSDGSFSTIKVYSTSVLCDEQYDLFNIVNCNGEIIGYFCLPSSFTCSYIDDNIGTTEICSIPKN
jgi:hypothetical protein